MAAFSTIPVNRNRRRSIFRAARLGTRRGPSVPDIGHAAKAVSVAAAYRNAWQGAGLDHPAISSSLRAIPDSWANRKDY